MLQPAQATEVAATFDLGGHAVLTGPVAAGRLGDVWRLSTDRGDYAVKDARFPIDHAEVAADAAYQDRVRSHGIPMPAVVRTPRGEALVELGSGPVRVYEWVEVGVPDRRLDPEVVGELVASIHRVEVPAAGPVDPWSSLRSASVPGATWWLASAAPAHRSSTAWENSGPADPAGELGVVLFEFGLGDPGRMRDLFASYVAAGGPARLDAPGDLTMLIAQSGHIARTGCERWLTATTEKDRADIAAWVGEFLDEPVTVETVEQILDVAR